MFVGGMRVMSEVAWHPSRAHVEEILRILVAAC